MIPALLTSTSSGPAASRKRANESSSVTSSWWPVASPASRAAACSASSPSRSPIATRAPRPARTCAVAKPMPLAAPVMATTRVTRGTLCALWRARRSLARERRRVAHRVVALAAAHEANAAVCLEDALLDLAEALEALALRHRHELRARDLLVPQRLQHRLAVHDHVARAAFEEAVRPRVAIGERPEQAVEAEDHRRADDRARHRVVVADDAVLDRVRDEQDHEQVERVLLRELALAEQAQREQQEAVDEHGAEGFLTDRHAHGEDRVPHRGSKCRRAAGRYSSAAASSGSDPSTRSGSMPSTHDGSRPRPSHAVRRPAKHAPAMSHSFEDTMSTRSARVWNARGAIPYTSGDGL